MQQNMNNNGLQSGAIGEACGIGYRQVNWQHRWTSINTALFGNKMKKMNIKLA